VGTVLTGHVHLAVEEEKKNITSVHKYISYEK
jgi:hypothetical protein